MGAAPERTTEQITLARIHAVFGTLAAAATVQLVGVTPMTPQLTLAVKWFAIGVILNTTCYFLETARHIPQFRLPLPLDPLLRLPTSFALYAPLYGMGYAIENVSEQIGVTFKIAGGTILGFHTIANTIRVRAVCKREGAIIGQCKKEVEKIKAEIDRLQATDAADYPEPDGKAKAIAEYQRQLATQEQLIAEARTRMRTQGYRANPLEPRLTIDPPVEKK